MAQWIKQTFKDGSFKGERVHQYVAKESGYILRVYRHKSQWAFNIRKEGDPLNFTLEKWISIKTLHAAKSHAEDRLQSAIRIEDVSGDV